MKYIKEYLEEALKIKPLGKVEFEECPEGEEVGYSLIIGGVHTPISVWWTDYASFLEKKLKEAKSPWIPADNEHLPECFYSGDAASAVPYHRKRSSENVIVRCGDIINRGYYSYQRTRWEWNGEPISVDHWMPIPDVK